MKKSAAFSLAVLATAVLLFFQMISPALAQDQGPPPEPPSAGDQPYQGQPDQDPPARAGRISYTEGSVSFQPGGQGDWLDAVRNRPLTVGDNLWVDKDSRAEIQIGGTSIRLGPETSLTFLDVGDNVTQLRLSLGSIFFRVRHFGGDDTFEVDTPNLAFNVDQPGEYRLDADQNGDQTIATVWHGAAEITGAGNSYRLGEGQMGTFSGTDQLSYDVGEIQQSDPFTQWCLSRDQQEDRLVSRQYVSDDMTGYEDLDEYGSWQSSSDYGNVWYPTGIAADWAPYRYGHWAYVYPWGWTWVEDEPWGFAPFHYGRWAFIGSRWGWVPGPVVVRPVYAPALVAFVGGFSIGVGTAPVGWFPLGPREVYVPWYRTSPRYVENVNITNTRVTVVQVTNVYHNYTVNHVTNVTYVNQHVNNSVTVVNRDTFVNARPVHNNVVRVDARQMASARVSPAVVTQVQPQRQSVMGTAHQVRYQPPAQALSRPVVATRQPVRMNRPTPAGEAFARPAAPPPVRTVKAAPRGQAQPLQRGARGGPAPNNARPNNQPNNAGAQNNRPNAPENRGAAPRPGAPNNQPNAPENRGAVPRPGAPGNQPNAPENRPNAPANGPENGRNANQPNRNVPRPPSANPQGQGQPGQQPRQYPGTRPENNRPENNAPENNPRGNNPQGNNPTMNNPPANNRPDNNRPQNDRPENRPEAQPPRPPQPEQARPEQSRPEQPSRPAETPQARPEQPARTPDVRQEPPRQPQNQPDNRPDNRPNNRPNNDRPQPPEARNNERNAPRPEARQAEPPRENRQASREDRSRNDKPPKDNKDKDKH
ncbi:MAG TPA: DUF6600 domain-containing protein [Terriglobales bacterium]|nr:DUF6600 domain-containing protein [Terriglobales bacterium]